MEENKYSRRSYNKLVTDNTPEIIAASGKPFECIEISWQRKLLEALRKVDEEFLEVQSAAAKKNNPEIICEIADVLLVSELFEGEFKDVVSEKDKRKVEAVGLLIKDIQKRHHISDEEINHELEEKRRTKGWYTKGIFLLRL